MEGINLKKSRCVLILTNWPLGADHLEERGGLHGICYELKKKKREQGWVVFPLH
jgi:hypothetical protein